MIRTADVAPDGRLKVTAGATLVRDSDAADEVAETHAKAGGILAALGLVRRRPSATAGRSRGWPTTRRYATRWPRATHRWPGSGWTSGHRTRPGCPGWSAAGR